MKKTVKIGRPGYRVTKQYDPEADQRSLLFQVGPRTDALLLAYNCLAVWSLPCM